MGFKRLFGIGDGAEEPVEVDTQVLSAAVYPGRKIEGEVVLRGGARGLRVSYLALYIEAKVLGYNGEERSRQIAAIYGSRSHFGVDKGQEERVAFGERLRWETPVTEVGGRALGPVVSVRTQLDIGDHVAESDFDLVHVSALPLHEGVLDAFAEEGYVCGSSYLVDSYIPDSEQHFGLYQTFLLADHVGGEGRPAELEVVFVMNAVGAVIHVRRAPADQQQSWRDRPPARRMVAAHHEVGRADWRPDVLRVLGEIALLDA